MEKISNRIIIVLIFLTALQKISYSQTFPKWFIDESVVHCKEKSVGYSDTSYFKDSSLAYAYKNGLINYAIKKFVSINTQNLFWKTEGGNFAISSFVEEKYDTTLVKTTKLKVADKFRIENLYVVLLVDSTCEITDFEKQLINIQNMAQPFWLTSLPSEDGFTYAKGESPNYYYLKSSWLEAEKNARINLAKNLGVAINSLQKRDSYEYQEIKKELTNINLRDVEVVSRWYDKKAKLIHVLIRMKNK